MATFDDIEKKKKAKEVTVVDPVADAQKAAGNVPPPPEDLSGFLQTYGVLLQALRTIKRPVATAPTFTPRTLTDQIQYYDSGGTRRLYLYISGTWRYVALT